MANGINIYSKLVVSRIRIPDISNWIPDIRNWNCWYQKYELLISRMCIYYWYQEIDLLISTIVIT